MWEGNVSRSSRREVGSVRRAAARRSRGGVAVEGLEERRLMSTGYALLGNGGTVLARFDTMDPTTILSTDTVGGLPSGTQLRGIDFRPSTGELYALGVRSTGGDDEGFIFTLDLDSGDATMVGPGAFSSALSPGASYGFDFNPAADRIRIFNDADQNLRVNPFTGFLTQFDTPLDNASNDEEVTGGAYDRNVNDVMPIGNPQALTTLYGIDFINDTLVTIGSIDGGAGPDSPNGGVVNEIGPLNITTGTSSNGFDIGQDGVAYALLNDQATGLTNLYTIDLTTGEATLVDALNNGSETVRGFALLPVDLPPIASPDSYNVPAGGSLTVPARGVLLNDIDPDGPDADLTAEQINSTINGSVTLNADGSFTYTPNPGFTGVDSFSYVAQDATSDSVVTAVTFNVVPTLTINDVAFTEGNSGTKLFTFTVSLSAPAGAGGATVNFNTSNQTAGEGDYNPTSGQVVFAQGEQFKQIDVTVKGDTKVESDETFRVNLSGAVGASIADNRGIGTIINDDAGPVTPKVFINNVQTTEGNSGTKNLIFTVTLDQSSSKTITMNFATQNFTAGEGDYQVKSGSLTFAAGQVSKTITIVIKGDTKVENNEQFRVNLTSLVNVTAGDVQGLGTILNDD